MRWTLIRKWNGPKSSGGDRGILPALCTLVRHHHNSHRYWYYDATTFEAAIYSFLGWFLCGALHSGQNAGTLNTIIGGISVPSHPDRLVVIAPASRIVPVTLFYLCSSVNTHAPGAIKRLDDYTAPVSQCCQSLQESMQQ